MHTFHLLISTSIEPTTQLAIGFLRKVGGPRNEVDDDFLTPIIVGLSHSSSARDATIVASLS